jgi:phosphoadenosine phosphosulfate reductase
MVSLEELTKLSGEFEKKTAPDILKWAFKEFGDEIAVSSSFGPGTGALLHMANTLRPGIKIIFIDTFYHFPETLEYKEKLEKLLKLNVLTYRSRMPRQEFKEKYTLNLHETNPDMCCHIHKVEPMKEALVGLRAWVTGLRRTQAETREKVQILEKYKEGIIKVNPLVNWTSKMVHDYMKEHKIPFHPLFDRGYTSVGCWPCTRPVFGDEDERAGRWANKEKVECGLHTFMHQDYQI